MITDVDNIIGEIERLILAYKSRRDESSRLGQFNMSMSYQGSIVSLIYLLGFIKEVPVNELFEFYHINFSNGDLSD